MSLMITAFITALFAIVVVPLSLQITFRRIAIGNVAYGDGNDFELRKKIETLGNYSEYVPLGLILLAFLESIMGQAWWVLGFGTLFFICRLIHAFGMLYGKTPMLRAIAMMGQHFYFIAVGGIIIYSMI